MQYDYKQTNKRRVDDPDLTKTKTISPFHFIFTTSVSNNSKN